MTNNKELLKSTNNVKISNKEICEKEEGFIGCTKCYRRKKYCECMSPKFHRIYKRAWYYEKFKLKTSNHSPQEQNNGTSLSDKYPSGVGENSDKQLKPKAKMSAPLGTSIEELEKGCGKLIIRNSNGNEVNCGKVLFVNVKHRKPILCPICEAKLEQAKADKEMFLKMFENWCAETGLYSAGFREDINIFKKQISKDKTINLNFNKGCGIKLNEGEGDLALICGKGALCVKCKEKQIEVGK